MKSYDRFVREIYDIQRWLHTTIYSYKVASSTLSTRLENDENVDHDVAEAFKEAGYNAFSLIHRLSTDNIKKCKELALIRSISALEVYLIDSIHEVFCSNKSPFMKEIVVEYHLGEILACSNIEQLHEKYIENICRQLHSGGFDHVKKFYKSRFNIDFTKFNTSIDSTNYGLTQIQQYHERRHLIIHRLGKTDEQYRKKYNSSETAIRLDENDLAIFLKVILSFAHHINGKMEEYITTNPPENSVEIKVEIIDTDVIEIFDPSFSIPVKKNTSLPLSVLLKGKEYESDSVFIIKLHGTFMYIRKYYKMLQKVASSGRIKILSYETVSQIPDKRKIKQYAWADVEKVIELLPEKPWPKNIHKEIAQNLGWSNAKVFGIINNIVNEQPSVLALTPRRKALKVGEEFSIAIDVPAALAAKVEWKSDNENVASISAGTVTAISPGFARISARITGTTNYDVCAIAVCEDLSSR